MAMEAKHTDQNKPAGQKPARAPRGLRGSVVRNPEQRE